jgi:hypothetical protein
MPTALDGGTAISQSGSSIIMHRYVHLCADRELFVTLKPEARAISKVTDVGGYSVAVRDSGDVTIAILQEGRQKLLLIR